MTSVFTGYTVTLMNTTDTPTLSTINLYTLDELAEAASTTGDLDLYEAILIHVEKMGMYLFMTSDGALIPMEGEGY